MMALSVYNSVSLAGGELFRLVEQDRTKILHAHTTDTSTFYMFVQALSLSSSAKILCYFRGSFYRCLFTTGDTFSTPEMTPPMPAP